MSIIKFGYINKYVNVDKRKITKSKKKLDAPQVPMIVSASRNIVIMAFYVNCFFITGKYII